MAPKKGYKAMLLTSIVITILLAVGAFFLAWKVIGWSVLWSIVSGIVAGLVVGAILYFWVFPQTGWFDAKANEPSLSEAVEADKATTFVSNGASYSQKSILAGFVAADVNTVTCDGVPLTALVLPETGSGYTCTSEGWKVFSAEAPVAESFTCEQTAFPSTKPANGYWDWSDTLCDWVEVPFPQADCSPILVPVTDSCPVAQPVAPGSAFNEYTFVRGQTYHLNLSLEGASAGVEGNLLFKATTTFTAQFDGASWSYAGAISDPGCQYCDETSGDYTLTLANVPQLIGLVEVLDAPCTTSLGTTTLPVHKLVVVP